MTSSEEIEVIKVNEDSEVTAKDNVAVEEPLEIKILFQDANGKTKTKTLSVTMRTPGKGQDVELAAGFLLTEGIIKGKQDLKNIKQTGEHSVTAILTGSIDPLFEKLERHFYTSSSCGVCGKTSIEAVKVLLPERIDNTMISVKASLLFELPEKLLNHQSTFESTGGLHASGLFDTEGFLIYLSEDVGRHNALDKLIGAALFEDRIPLNRSILLLSGRSSFELIQKAAMAGIDIVCAIGAPSSLAVELAKERNITLAGFLRKDRFNIYSGKERIIF